MRLFYIIATIVDVYIQQWRKNNKGRTELATAYRTKRNRQFTTRVFTKLPSLPLQTLMICVYILVASLSCVYSVV